jgi:hypothetical protein
MEIEVTDEDDKKFGNNSYQTDLFFVRSRERIGHLFTYLKRQDKEWVNKKNKLCEKSVEWKKDGYRLKWSKLEWYMPKDIFRSRGEKTRKRWKRLKKMLNDIGKFN